jgi:hypothetical protein
MEEYKDRKPFFDIEDGDFEEFEDDSTAIQEKHKGRRGIRTAEERKRQKKVIEEQRRCFETGGRTSTGGPCKNIAMENGRCKSHGGKNLYVNYIDAVQKGLLNPGAKEADLVEQEANLPRKRTMLDLMNNFAPESDSNIYSLDREITHIKSLNRVFGEYINKLKDLNIDDPATLDKVMWLFQTYIGSTNALSKIIKNALSAQETIFNVSHINEIIRRIADMIIDNIGICPHCGKDIDFWKKSCPSCNKEINKNDILVFLFDKISQLKINQ